MAIPQTNITAHSFSFTAIDGVPLPLSSLTGKVVLIVNTASECGFTPQYRALQELYDRYQSQGLVVVAVPSNDFGKQEPGTEELIQQFCADTFGVTFPITEKCVVKGKQIHPFYGWAGKELGFIAKPRWNFHKYLVAPDGRLVTWFATPTPPLSNRVIRAIKNILPGGQSPEMG